MIRLSAALISRSAAVAFAQRGAHDAAGSAMATIVAKRFKLLRHFQGEPQPSDFELLEEQLPALGDGDVLAEAQFLSVDPYMRIYVLRQPPGGTMIGGQVARVLESRHPDWQAGDLLVSRFGWRTHTVFNADKAAQDAPDMRPYKLPDIGDLSPSLGLGVLGMPGNTAYFGFLEICQPKEGETVVISGAAGAVGSIVGQIAKIKGCRVIGFAGSDDKVQWLKKQLGFDFAYNYKTKDVGEALRESAPGGVDCYFDNVGGEMSSTVAYHMKMYGRISCCGTISFNNHDPANYPKATVIQRALINNRAKMQGFTVWQWMDRWMEGITQNLEWIQQGKIKYQETVTEGFENMPAAFIGMLRGQNTGKAIVKNT